MTTREFADKFGITLSRVNQLIGDKRIHGAVKIGRDWLIPETEAAKFKAVQHGSRIWIHRIKADKSPENVA